MGCAFMRALSLSIQARQLAHKLPNMLSGWFCVASLAPFPVFLFMLFPYAMLFTGAV
jgi:hypothetical protein